MIHAKKPTGAICREKVTTGAAVFLNKSYIYIRFYRKTAAPVVTFSLHMAPVGFFA